MKYYWPFQFFTRDDEGTGVLKYSIELSPGFKNDFKLVQKLNNDAYAITRLIERIANGERLETQFRDLNLKDEYKNYREGHIKPDLLLIYKIWNGKLILTRIGSNSALFE